MASKFARDGGIAFCGHAEFFPMLAADARARFSNFAQDSSPWVPTALLPVSSRRRQAGQTPSYSKRTIPKVSMAKAKRHCGLRI
jgi:hypothetical protein